MKIIKTIIYCLALVVLFGACKDPMTEITETTYPRAFTPTDVVVTPSTFDAAEVSWKAIDGALTYDVELSRGDSMLFENIIMDTVDVEGTRLALAGLWGETQYSIRVKAKTFADGQQDSKWQGLAFKTSAEQIFSPVKEVEVKGTTAIVRWSLPNGAVTKLNVKAATVTGGDDIALTAEQIAAGSYTVTGLDPDTKYEIGIYDGDQRRGLRTITTQWKPAGGEANVVMVNLGDDLATICSDVANIGKIIYLPDGYTFTASENPGIVLAGNMTIYGDPDAAVKPKITHTKGGGGNRLFSWTADCNIDEIKFVNLSLEGPANNGNTVFAARDDNRIEALKHIYLEKCDLFQFGRCFIRIEGTIHNPIEKVTLNNCIFNDIGAFGGVNGNYAFFTMNVGGGGINNIVVTNSTFRKVYHSLLNAPHTNGNNPCKSISIENSTFNDFITGPGASSGRIFIDGNNNTELTISMRGVILGQSGPKASGYRISTASGSTAAIAVANTYSTSDYISETAGQALPSVTPAGVASTALFQDTINGNFTIKDAAFAGKATAGDPRWRP